MTGIGINSATHRIFLASGHFLDSKSVVEQAVTGEVLAHELLDKLNT